MSKNKLTFQAAEAARIAAAEANTRANETLEAFRARLFNDHRLGGTLVQMIATIRGIVNDSELDRSLNGEFRDRLEATANSYGFTLADHPTRKDLVVVTPLEN